MTSEAHLDKAKVRHSFAAAAETYDGFASLQRQVGLELLCRFPQNKSAGVLLDLGCGTGFISHQLSTAFSGKQMIALDIALPMLQTSRQKYPAMPVQYLCADAEKLPIASNSVDQIFSNLALQWAEDLPASCADFKRVLNKQGQLIFATFGPETLRELKAAWAKVDDFTHVNVFHSADQIHDFLKVAGFKQISLEIQLYQSAYSDVEGLMRELKGIGAHNVNRLRNPKPTTKSQLKHMIRHYPAQMVGQGIIASYEIIFVKASI